MEHNFKVSIIIPVYNVEQYIGRCIKSIFRQEIENVSMECIIVDDCSPDSSIETVNKLIKNYFGNIVFRIIRHEKNRGLSAARNTGINNANGDYITFVDSDDYLNNNAISAMLKVIEKYPQVESVTSNYYHCKEKKIPIPIEKQEVLFGREKIMDYFYSAKLKNSACFKLVSRKHILDNKIFFIEGLLYEDVLWSYRQYSTSSCIALIPDVTYVYEYNPQSIVNTTLQKIQKNINSLMFISDKLMDEPYQGHFVDLMLFAFSFIVRALDLMQKHDTTNEQHKQFCKIRKKLISNTVKKKRFILSSFFILLYKPFSYLLNVDLFCKTYDKQSKLVALTEKTFNWLHSK